ncbi:MAG: BlaI/MecI/CopY family transcriptional regulator [Planctomycetota bacterium]
MPTATEMGRVQLLIMQVLWRLGRATAREITEALNESNSGQESTIAHSTVQTLLRQLEDKGSVSHEAKGRTFTFFAVVNENEFKESAAANLLHRVFQGSVTDLVSQLLSVSEVSEEEQRALRKLINKNSRKGKR